MTRFKAIANLGLILSAWAISRTYFVWTEFQPPKADRASGIAAPKAQIEANKQQFAIPQIGPSQSLVNKPEPLAAFGKLPKVWPSRQIWPSIIPPSPKGSAKLPHLYVERTSEKEPLPTRASTASAPESRKPDIRKASVPTQFTVSAWTYWRASGVGSGLASASQLGGSQSGFRIGLPSMLAFAGLELGPQFRAATALSPVGQQELALGITLKPARSKLPVSITVERRQSISGGGRNAFALFGVGGIYEPLGGGDFRLNGYGQAGIVGLKKRDGFVDLGLRLERPIALGKSLKLVPGIGGWGAAQPKASRVDVGPSLAVSMPVGPTTMRATLDWRFKLAGDARPGSGPALTIGADF